jgi:hypothetical protein
MAKRESKVTLPEVSIGSHPARNDAARLRAEGCTACTGHPQGEPGSVG